MMPRCDGDRLSPIVRAELIHDVLKVNFDGFLGDEEPIGNLFIPINGGHQPKDLHFRRGEIFFGQILRHVRRHLRRYPFLSRMNLPDRFKQLLRCRALEQIAAGPGLQERPISTSPWKVEA